MNASLRSGMRWLRHLSPLVAGVVCAWAQTTTGGPSTGGATGTAPGSANSSPGNILGGASGVMTTSPGVTGSSAGSGGSRSIFLSGTVMMDDGSPLPGIVSIQSLCGGVRRTMGQTTGSGGEKHTRGNAPQTWKSGAPRAFSFRCFPTATDHVSIQLSTIATKKGLSD